MVAQYQSQNEKLKEGMRELTIQNEDLRSRFDVRY